MSGERKVAILRGRDVVSVDCDGATGSITFHLADRDLVFDSECVAKQLAGLGDYIVAEHGQEAADLLKATVGVVHAMDDKKRADGN